MRPTRALLALALLVAAAPVAAPQANDTNETEPPLVGHGDPVCAFLPSARAEAEVAGALVHAWVGVADANETLRVEPGARTTLHLCVDARQPAADAVTVAAWSGADFEDASAATENETGPGAYFARDFRVPDDAEGELVLSFRVEVQERNETTGNLTTLDAGDVTIPVEVVGPAPAPPEVPLWVWAAAGLLVLLVLAFFLARSRRRQVRAPPRSRALAELELERRAERASERARAELAERQAEVEARERQRLEERERSIADAKRNDILRSIDLARQRMERGEITEFQFRKLREKKEQQLADLDRGA